MEHPWTFHYITLECYFYPQDTLAKFEWKSPGHPVRYLRNSWMIGSRTSAGKSSHLAGNARSLFTLVFELALLKLGHPGSGHAVYRPLTALHLQVLHTRAPGATWSSRSPYWDAWLRGSALLCVFPSTMFWQTVQAWGPICLPPSRKVKKYFRSNKM